MSNKENLVCNLKLFEIKLEYLNKYEIEYHLHRLEKNIKKDKDIVGM